MHTDNFTTEEYIVNTMVVKDVGTTEPVYVQISLVSREQDGAA